MRKNSFIHPTAIIDEGSEIGEGVSIWHFCHIMSEARIGDNCSLGQNVMIASRVILGKNVKIQNNVSLYEGVVCEDNVFLGPSAVFTNVINPRSEISRRDEYKTTRVKVGATIGANATIICGIDIGMYAFVGAGAVVTKQVADYALVVGNPAKTVGWMSEHGNKLIFDKEGIAVCKTSGQEYRLKANKAERIK